MTKIGVLFIVLLFVLVELVVADRTELCEEFGCDQDCKVVDNVPVCGCYRGFQLDSDGKTCTDVNECLEEAGACPFECLNTLGSYKCLCPDGSTVNPKKKDVCKNHDHQTTTKATQVIGRRGRTQPMLLNNQMNIRRTKHYFPKHQHLSQVTVEQSSRGAPPKLKIIRKQTFEEKYEDVVDISIPLLPHLSLESTKKLKNFVQSALDEADKREQGCEGGTCLCKKGYRLASDGKTCIDLNECMNGQAKCDPGKCMNTIGSARCICPEGFIQSEGLSCIDVDECNLPDLPCTQVCVNIPGAFRCDCNPGYQLLPDGMTCEQKPKTNNSEPPTAVEKPLTISVKSLKTVNGTKQTTNHYYDKDDPLVQESLQWLQVFSNIYAESEKAKKEEGEKEKHKKRSCNCQNGGICLGGKCVCPPGYHGKRCQHDVDECSTGHLCDQMCVNTHGSYQCACSDGFLLESDGTTCSQVPCTKDCQNGGTCLHNTCSCKPGFQGDDCSADIDECAEAPCEQICRNTMGSYECDCIDGFSLKEDNSTCSISEEKKIQSLCDPECLNGGICQDGVCNCTEEYSGNRCENKEPDPTTESSPFEKAESVLAETALPAYGRPVVYKLVSHSNKLEALNQVQEEKKKNEEKAKRDKNDENDVMRDTPFVEEEDDANSIAHPSAAFYFNQEFVTNKLTTTTITPKILDLVRSVGNKTCFFRSQAIKSGEKFFRDESNCSRCLCVDGEIRCQPRHCSRSSCAEPIKGQCCDYCPEDCVVDHQVYKNGMAFVSDLDPCRSCSCVDGRVLCDDIRCPPLECEAQYRVLPADRCCPECFAPEPGCFYRSRFYYKRQLWVDHSKCQTCLCKDDNHVQCNPRVCLTECTHPIFKSGDCCPQCNSGCQLGNTIYADGEKFQSLENPCSDCRCLHGNITCTEQKCEEPKCHHNGKTWAIGDNFHWGDDPCTSCSCESGGTVKCKTLECESKCLHGVLFHDRCCPLCEGCDYLGTLRSNGEEFISEENGKGLECECTNGTVTCVR